MSDDPLLPLDEAARRLGVSAETVLRYARRKRWRKIKGNDGVLVAVPAEMLDNSEKAPQEQAYPSPPAVQAPDLAAIVQATIAPIQALLERKPTRCALFSPLPRSSGPRRLVWRMPRRHAGRRSRSAWPISRTNSRRCASRPRVAAGGGRSS